MSLPGHEKLPTVWPEKSQRAGDTIIYGLILYKSTLRIYFISDINQDGHIMTDINGGRLNLPFNS